jgi:hypothetical protein
MLPLGRPLVAAAVTVLASAAASAASAQVVYYPAYRPVVAAPVIQAPVVAAPTYVANYVPAGNYAAVTAFSPPLVAEPAAIAVRAAYPPAYAPMPAAPVVVTMPAAPVVAAPLPVTTYYAPAAVAVPMRRGILGGWRPVRGAYVIPY